MAEGNARDAGLSVEDPAQAELAKAATEDLRAEFLKLAPELVRITNRRRELSTELERREKTQQAADLVGNLSSEERAALRKALAEVEGEKS